LRVEILKRYPRKKAKKSQSNNVRMTHIGKKRRWREIIEHARGDDTIETEKNNAEKGRKKYHLGEEKTRIIRRQIVFISARDSSPEGNQ